MRYKKRIDVNMKGVRSARYIIDGPFLNRVERNVQKNLVLVMAVMVVITAANQSGRERQTGANG